MAVTIVELTSAIDNLRSEMEGKLGDMKKDVIGATERFKVDGERTELYSRASRRWWTR